MTLTTSAIAGYVMCSWRRRLVDRRSRGSHFGDSRRHAGSRRRRDRISRDIAIDGLRNGGWLRRCDRLPGCGWLRDRCRCSLCSGLGGLRRVHRSQRDRAACLGQAAVHWVRRRCLANHLRGRIRFTHFDILGSLPYYPDHRRLRCCRRGELLFRGALKNPESERAAGRGCR